ncbi:MAG: hypothetical protein COB71_10375 [Thiotrichales bacterium]|nr:MAG: hypothetical protein COB71_10375 [Thiotrichales bacterium]
MSVGHRYRTCFISHFEWSVTFRDKYSVEIKILNVQSDTVIRESRYGTYFVFLSANIGVGVSIKEFSHNVGVVADPPQPCKIRVADSDA